MHYDLSDFVKQWSIAGLSPFSTTPNSDESFEDILRQIGFMDDHAFSRYVPAIYSKYSPVFQDRMVAWLNNPTLTEQDKIALFQFILRLAYYSFDDIISLYRSAYSGQISRWVWEQLQLDLGAPDYSQTLEDERNNHTWYTSITDSLIISEFYHANDISGIGCRPNFLTLKELGNPTLVDQYVKSHNLKRIVLLEDFVGSGQQAYSIVDWALKSTDLNFLLCPMIICPDGHRRFDSLASASSGRLKLDPVIRLGDSVFISSHDHSDPVVTHVADLIQRIHPQVQGNSPAGGAPYGPMGFHRRYDTHKGATVVLFSNTPNNTIPIVHFGSSQSDWHPIFPRVSRETP